jgi:hypothetical protein
LKGEHRDMQIVRCKHVRVVFLAGRVTEGVLGP